MDVSFLPESVVASFPCLTCIESVSHPRPHLRPLGVSPLADAIVVGACYAHHFIVLLRIELCGKRLVH